MLELVMTACLLAQPAKCQTVYPSFAPPSASMMQCLYEGQLQAVRWAEQHPKWHVVRWSCGEPEA